LVLLTKAPLLVKEGAALAPPPLHLLCMVESIDTVEKHRGEKTVIAHLNLQTGSTGGTSPWTWFYTSVKSQYCREVVRLYPPPPPFEKVRPAWWG